VDVFLNKVCIFKSRSQVQKQCAAGLITVDGSPAKASKEIAEGSRVGFSKGPVRWEIRILAVPERSVSRRDSRSYYEVTRKSPGEADD